MVGRQLSFNEKHDLVSHIMSLLSISKVKESELTWYHLFDQGEVKFQSAFGKMTDAAKVKLFYICSRASQLLRWALSGVDDAALDYTLELAVDHDKVWEFHFILLPV